MSFSFIRYGEEILTSRRGILRAGGLTLSGTAIAMLAGRESLAASSKTKSPDKDVGILNSALGAELEGACRAAGLGGRQAGRQGRGGQGQIRFSG